MGICIYVVAIVYTNRPLATSGWARGRGRRSLPNSHNLHEVRSPPTKISTLFTRPLSSYTTRGYQPLYPRGYERDDGVGDTPGCRRNHHPLGAVKVEAQ